jgi:hypothetical protein
VEEKHKLITPQKLFMFWVIPETISISLASKTYGQPHSQDWRTDFSTHQLNNFDEHPIVSRSGHQFEEDWSQA